MNNMQELQLGRIEATRRRRERVTTTYNQMREKGIDHASIADALGLSRAALDNSLRRYNIERIPEPTERDYVQTEIDHFTKFGYTTDQIGERLGFTPAVFRSRLSKYKIRVPDPGRNLAEKVMNRLIDEGVPFTNDHLPGLTKSENAITTAMLENAVREGRIRKVGTRPGMFSRQQINVFQSVHTTEEMVAA